MDQERSSPFLQDTSAEHSPQNPKARKPFWKRPVLRFAVPYVVCVTIVYLYLFSDAAIPDCEVGQVPVGILVFLSVLYGVPLWLFVWCLRFLGHIIRIRGRRVALERSQWFLWLVEPGWTLLLWGLLIFDLPFKLRFEISRPSLEAEAQRLTAKFAEKDEFEGGGWETSHGHRKVHVAVGRVGLFRVIRAEVIDGEWVRFLTVRGGRDGAGVAYHGGGNRTTVKRRSESELL